MSDRRLILRAIYLTCVGFGFVLQAFLTERAKERLLRWLYVRAYNRRY